MKNDAKTSQGFTLIEILVVIGVIAILAVVIVVALNPSRQLAQARNTQRWSNINTILTAINRRLADNRGTWPTTGGCPPLPSTFTFIGSGPGNVNLAPCLTPTYISMMVSDPSSGSAEFTNYEIRRGADGHITVRAPHAELGEVISAAR